MTRILLEEVTLEQMHPPEVSMASKPPSMVNTQTSSSCTASSSLSTVDYNK